MKKRLLKLSLDYVEPEDWRDEKEKKKLGESEWRNKREKILKKYDYTCQYCGFRHTKWQIVHHINHDKKDNRLKNLIVMCQMCNVVHHSGFGCIVQGVVDLYKESKYSQNKIVQITRKLREEGKTDNQIKRYLGLKKKVKFKQNRKYLKKLYGFVSDRFTHPQNVLVKSDERLPSQETEDYWLYAENGKNMEVKIMPDTASERALERLKLNVCSEENNCSIELKEVGNGNQTKAAYEVKVEKQARVLGLFKTKMQVQAQVDAENGEVIQTKKPWWAFLASESEE